MKYQSGLGPPDLKLLVEAIEDRAKWFPNNTFMRYPPPDWEATGYRSLSWRQYLDGINKTAHWLDEQLGCVDTWGSFETVAYAGPNDARYAFIFPAVIKTKRKVGQKNLFLPWMNIVVAFH